MNQPPRLSLLQGLLLALFVMLSLLMFGSAFFTWRLRCEGFGCMGIGIVWMAWAVLVAVCLVLGLSLQASLKTRLPAGAQRLLRLTLWAEGGLTAGLLIYWMLRGH